MGALDFLAVACLVAQSRSDIDAQSIAAEVHPAMVEINPAEVEVESTTSEVK
jgi:hypothetical protein